jgi:two-component system, OmpR family, sensor histidine kinase VicK
VTVPSSWSHTKSERTEVLYGTEKTTNVILNFLSTAQIKMNICADSTWPSVAIGIDIFKKALINVKERGIKTSYLTEITRDNLFYCKELIKIGELHHLDGIKGNFAVSEKEYVASATMREASLLQQVIYSNVKEVLEQQQYVFDSFWNRSIPAEQKIREIEEGIEPEFYDIIADRKKAAQILTDLAQSIKRQALILLPNDKSMVRLNRLGVIDYTIKASQEKGAEVKIICPLSEVNSEIVKKILNNARNIIILNGNNTPYGMYIVDGEKFLRAELREPNAEAFSESIGFTFYSNSKLSVNSFKSVFELLWKEHALNEELRRADKMQKEFINVASHEIKTPTQAILGYTEILQKHPEKREQISDALYRNANRLQRLTSNILDVTRIESQTLKLRKENFGLTDLISTVMNDFKNDIQKKGNNVALLYGPKDNLVIEADKERITQVISNLLSNAIKFTKEGSISINVVKDSKYNNHQQEEVVVSVKDTGTGIDSEIFPRLFTKFATKSDMAGGTGLGLFISKNIVESHGGRMWANNNRDILKNGERRGATFSFTLPLMTNNIRSDILQGEESSKK